MAGQRGVTRKDEDKTAGPEAGKGTLQSPSAKDVNKAKSQNPQHQGAQPQEREHHKEPKTGSNEGP